MLSRSVRPGCLQLALALAAVLYLASLWFFPQVNPVYGLVLLVILAAGSGVLAYRAALQPREVLPPPAASALPAAGHTRPSQPASLDDTGPAVTTSATAPRPAARRGAARTRLPRERLLALCAARRSARQAGDGRAEAACAAELAAAYGQAGRPRLAQLYAQRALDLASQSGDQPGAAAAWGQLAQAQVDLGQPRRAIELYQEQVRLLHALGERASEARASWDLGLVYEDVGDLPQAIAAMQVYVDYKRATGQPDAETDAALLDQLRAQAASETPGSSGSPLLPGK